MSVNLSCTALAFSRQMYWKYDNFNDKITAKRIKYKIMFVCFNLIDDDGEFTGIQVNGTINDSLKEKARKLVMFALKNKKEMITANNGKIMLLFEYAEFEESKIARIVSELNKELNHGVLNFFRRTKVSLNYENRNRYKLNVRRSGFEKIEVRFVPLSYVEKEPVVNYRTSKNIQAKNRKVHILNYELFPPVDTDISKIYEKFVELEDLGKLPKKKWFKDIGDLIEITGEEKYLEHLEYTINKMVAFQKAHNEIELKIKAAKKRKETKYFRDFSPVDNYQEAPTHYYFYTSMKGRYLKGLILSACLISNNNVLELLEEFAIDCPFQTKGISQAPTGLYVYDILFVFSQLEFPDSAKHIFNVKLTVRQTWAQKKMSKYLIEIANKKGIEVDELYKKYGKK